jgi:hypothetical protein
VFTFVVGFLAGYAGKAVYKDDGNIKPKARPINMDV